MTSQADNYYRDLCENLGFVMIAVDRDLNVRFVNKEAASHFDDSADNPSGRCVRDVFHGQQHEEVQRVFEETIRTRTSGEIEIKCDRMEGQRRTFILIVSPIINASGDCVGASACMRDISERKRLSQELARNRRMAALGNMATGVAHNYNNILGGMLTSIDYVLPSDSPRELRRTLRMLVQAIGRATRITQQLEAFAECEHEKTEYDALNTLMNRFIERIRPQAERARIKLDTDIAEVSSGPFEAQRLMPVLESLAQNAFDAMSPAGTLTVAMRQDNGDAVVTISDTGCGIPDDVLDRVFEPFFTTKGALAGGSGGNIGLGMAAVHGLVAELGGTIQLTSKMGQGTTVELHLPLDRPTRT